MSDLKDDLVLRPTILERKATVPLTLRRRSSYADGARSENRRPYSIRMDGKHIAGISAREKLVFAIPPGVHFLQVRIGIWGSRKIRFIARLGEQLSLECGSSLSGRRIILKPIYLTLLRHRYLWLRRVD